jgi:G protein-coupled receptor kinase interacting protein 2
MHASVTGPRSHLIRSEVSDDEPLYDSVASDEDYVTAASLDTLSALSAVPSLAQSSSDEKEASPQLSNLPVPSADTKADSSKPVVPITVNGEASLNMEELLKKQLELSEARLDSMTQEIRALQATVSSSTLNSVNLLYTS